MTLIETSAISASLEDYLEAIYQVTQDKKVARGKDISKRMGVSKASVTGALHSLSEKELINYTPYEFITLTPEGERLAKDVVRRHQMLKEFFVTVLGIEESEASDNACRMEHVVSEDLLQRLIQFIEFVKICPRAGAHWVEHFGYFCEYPNHGESSESCSRCMNNILEDLKKG